MNTPNTKPNLIDVSTPLRFETRVYINDKYLPARSGNVFSTINPATGKTLTEVSECDEADVDDTVSPARRTFEAGSWLKAAPK